MELIDYIDGLLIDVPSIPDYWITARLTTAFKGNASIWYTEMKEVHGRRSWPWWKSQIIQKYSNDTWVLKKTIKFMRNHKLLTQTQGELENAVRCICNQNFTLDDISNTLQDKQPFRVEFKEKPRERGAEVAKNKNSCHNCGSTDHYANDFPKEKKKVYSIEKFPTEDSEADSMGDAIREQSDDEKDPREDLIVEYQEETPLEIQDIQLEAVTKQDASNRNLCKHTQKA
ncbi:hypothetical protein O181_040459 [Austropuccinia psidii MF-1]|uniref:Uncharacterized protein n=1 Tax=Austropuccinia psidii MF-1 TaxID=1389203 RepID=A0A9Q3DCG7_9BASI|nr:hypothetical protein [Austropuccinia psidii MF-1]